jgi:hypothetical protein
MIIMFDFKNLCGRAVEEYSGDAANVLAGLLESKKRTQTIIMFIV